MGKVIFKIILSSTEKKCKHEWWMNSKVVDT